ncbi:MAG TPA: glycosyltransferase, partial [Ktedonobacteraceae bacterium]|nr:glycosyltransferase [Ktedonobacteraceae bacterium]
MTIQQQINSDKEQTAAGRTRKLSPRLSVILCTYNRCNLVLSALASLRRQTLAYDQFEVLVIDNGSTDGTLGAVRAYVNAGNLP